MVMLRRAQWLLVVLMAGLAGPALAVTLQAGDIIVVDAGRAAPAVPVRVIRIDPASGAQEVISSGGQLLAPAAISVERANTILIAGIEASGRGSVVRVDPAGGSQTVLSTPYAGLSGLTIRASDGSIFVTDPKDRAVYRVNPTSGARTAVGIGPALLFPQAIAAAPDGLLYIADFGSTWRTVRINPANGNASPLSPSFQLAAGLAASPGALWVADSVGRSLTRVDLNTAAQSVLSSGNELLFPYALAVGPGDQLLVADWGSETVAAAVVRVDRTTASQSVVSRGGLLVQPRGIAVVPARCANGADDDGDGLADFPSDPGCASSDDDSEKSPSLVCDDGIDQDGDGTIDRPADPGCKDRSSNKENPQCQDGLDNDGDGKFDFDGGAAANGGIALGPLDPQCEFKPSRDKEAPSTCGLGAEIILPAGFAWIWRRRSRR